MNSDYLDQGWKNVYLAGGTAAILAGSIFRRNLGVEISLILPVQLPAAVSEWYTLLERNRLLGLAYLGIFDIVNYILVGIMFLALVIALRRINPGLTIVGFYLGFLGIAIYAASNTAFSVISLSNQYFTATSPAQLTLLLAAGHALLSLNRFSSPGAHPGAGGYVSLLLVASSGMIFSSIILRSKLVHPTIAWFGLVANGLDLMYCLAFPFAPATINEQLGLLFIPTAGLFFMIWHIMIGWWLLKQWRKNRGGSFT